MIVSKSFDFCAGHRLRLHESKCRHLHGHNWTVTVSVESDKLDEVGRVVDFSVIRERVKGWVDQYLDHGFILERTDAEAIEAVGSVSGQSVYLMDGPPTAENLSRLIKEQAQRLLGMPIHSVSIRETETSEALCTG